MRQNKKNVVLHGKVRTGLDDFENFCGSGLDRIQFFRIRIGLGLEMFTVRSSLLDGKLMKGL